MTSKHTPTPWRLFTGDKRRITDQYGNRICSLGGDQSTGLDVSKGATPEGNAALIVKAVNAHEDLVEQLTSMRDDFCKKNCDAEHHDHWEECEKATAALTKAGADAAVTGDIEISCKEKTGDEVLDDCARFIKAAEENN